MPKFKTKKNDPRHGYMDLQYDEQEEVHQKKVENNETHVDKDSDFVLLMTICYCAILFLIIVVILLVTRCNAVKKYFKEEKEDKEIVWKDEMMLKILSRIYILKCAID